MGGCLEGRLKDGEGSGYLAGVTRDHALKVTPMGPQSAFDRSPEELTRIKLFRGFLKDEADSKDMNVDGSVTPVSFRIGISPDRALWIMRVRIILNGVNFELDTVDARRFGAATAVNTPLPNGIEFKIIQGGIETLVFAEPVRRTIEFLTYADADKTVNLKNTVSAQSDFLSFDFTFDAPIALPPAVTDELVMTINDDLTPLELFQASLFGVQEIAVEEP